MKRIIDNRIDKLDIAIILVILSCVAMQLVLNYVFEPTPYVETVAQINLCTIKDGKLTRVIELPENLPRYICGTTNKTGEYFEIMIYDSNDQPIWGDRILDSEETFEMRIVDKLPPGKYRMEITGVRKIYDTTDFVILEQPR